MVHSQETRAILDMKWSSSQRGSLALTTSSGDLIVYSLEDSQLKSTKSVKIENSPVLLSLDWNDRLSNSSELKIVASDSQGQINLISAPDLKIEESRKIHDFEAWIVIFDAWNSKVIFSGGDDSKLFMTDLRTNSKIRVGIHDAGVTSLLSDIHEEFKLYSGSYDENLRIITMRIK